MPGYEKRGQARVEAEAPPVIASSPDLSHAADGAEAERLRDLPLDTPNPRTWRGCPPAVFGTIALKPFQRAMGRSSTVKTFATSTGRRDTRYVLATFVLESGQGR